jgi:hypothetical protein
MVGRPRSDNGRRVQAPSVPPWSWIPIAVAALGATVSCSWCTAIHLVGGIPTAGTSSADMSSRASRIVRPSVGNASKNSVFVSTTHYSYR